MNQIKLQLCLDSDNIFPLHADIILPQFLAKQWRIPLNRPVTVTCGSSVSDVRLIFSYKANKTRAIRIRSSVARHLGIHHSCLVNVRYASWPPCLKFGPVLGILTNGIRQQAKNELRFDGMTRFFNECQDVAAQRGVLMFVFSPEDLNVHHKQINGWVRIGNRWVHTACTLPDVIYNRITSRRIEGQSTLQQQLEWLKRRYHVQLFNETFLDKWQVHRALLQDPNIKLMLPETQPYEKSSQLKSMLKKYPIVYVKPVNGSLGQGVMRITSKGPHYHMQYTTLNGTITKSRITLTEFTRLMARRKRHNPYLIQQGVPLMTSMGRSIDFRALVQKDGAGRWSLTSLVGRIASDASIVSNLARGGTVGGAAHILQQVDRGQVKPTTGGLRRSALKVAYAFERQISGHFAELGIDLAVDRSGKVWLLEINSKPSKTDDAIANPSLTIRPSVRKTINYVCRLSGYAQPSNRRRRTGSRR